MTRFEIVYPEWPAPYRDILSLQRSIFNSRVESKRSGADSGNDCVIVVEHKPVITLGKHGHRENLLLPEDALRQKGIEVIPIERGGDITYHGPGQLVVYPIIDMERYRLGVRKYVETLEECVIRTLADYGIRGERVEGASGVWIGKDSDNERKICAVGVKCSRFITMHGLALNVNTRPEAFSAINPCGFVDKGVTSIAVEKGEETDMREVAVRLVSHLTQLLFQGQASPPEIVCLQRQNH